jgi:hypothetical protein
MTIEFTKNEKNMLLKLAALYKFEMPKSNDWTYEQAEKVRDAAMDFEVLQGLDESYKPTKEGLLAISIADKLLKVA